MNLSNNKIRYKNELIKRIKKQISDYKRTNPNHKQIVKSLNFNTIDSELIISDDLSQEEWRDVCTFLEIKLKIISELNN